MADALVLDGVSKVYEVGGIELVALDEVDLAVAEEEVVTLLGPSGSGKTTLLSIAGGLLSATSGRVVVGGKDITRAGSRKLTAFRRKRIGFIFQAVNLVPFLTARENLLVVAELARRDRSAAAQRANRLLDELGLGHRMGNLPSQLSGGERQRVAIGRALMNRPALVLVDEPTSALDSDLGQQVMELIVSEVKARGAAAVVVTHDQRMARYGDRVLTMADGRIAGMAPRPEFMADHGLAPPAALPTAPDPFPPAAGFPTPAAATYGAAPASGQFSPTDGWAAAATGPAAVPDPFPPADGFPTPAAAHGAGPASGRFPPADGWANGAAGPGPAPDPFPPAEGFPAAAAYGAGPASGQFPVPDRHPAGAAGHGPASGAFPAADGRTAGQAAGFAGADPGPVAGRVPAPASGRVPAGLWANGPAVSPLPEPGETGETDQGWGVDPPGRGPGTGQVPAAGRRPDPYDGLPGPLPDRPAAAPARPISAQMPVVPAPDRVWRRPATPPPPSARPGGGRHPPPSRPAPSAASPVPPAGWPGRPHLPEPSGGEVPAGPDGQPPAWGPPEIFADPPPVAPGDGIDGTGGIDGIESERSRWLQQLTPPPTRSRPRPPSVPDNPIWPTRYWNGDDDEP